MLPFGIGFSEILLIMVVLLLVVGPKKLPELAKSLGKGVRVARRAGDELKAAVAAEEAMVQRPWEQDQHIEDVDADTHDYEAAGSVDEPHDESDLDSDDPGHAPTGQADHEELESGIEDLPENVPVPRDPHTLVNGNLHGTGIGADLEDQVSAPVMGAEVVAEAGAPEDASEALDPETSSNPAGPGPVREAVEATESQVREAPTATGPEVGPEALQPEETPDDQSSARSGDASPAGEGAGKVGENAG